VNVDIANLEPGTFGVSHGSGIAAEAIRTGTQSWAGHAFLYLGDNVLVEGWPPVARLNPADTYGDALWSYRMWDWCRANQGWNDEQIKARQARVVGRGHAQVGQHYDFQAYLAFLLEFEHLRNETQMDRFFDNDTHRVCSALVDDAEVFGGVPMIYEASDGPGLTNNPNQHIVPNLVSPGMLLGISQRLGWL
jgi:hypothetical protein